MASFYKNNDYVGDVLEILQEVHEVKKVGNTADGQEVYKVTQFGFSQHFLGTGTPMKDGPIAEMTIVGKDLEFVQRPNGSQEIDGFDIQFKSGTFSEVSIEAPSPLSNEPLSLFSFKGEGDVMPNAKMLNRPSEKIEERLEKKANGDIKEEFVTKPATVEKNDDFHGNPFEMFETAHSIKKLANNADGEEVFEITQYSQSSNPTDTTFNKPILTAIVTGKDIQYTTTPKGEHPSQGVDIKFTSGEFTSMAINDYVGSTASQLGEPREVYKFDSNGEVSQSTQLLNKAAGRIEKKLDRYASDDEGNHSGNNNHNNVDHGNTVKIYDAANVVQYIQGTEAREAFVIDGKSSDYGWGKTDDGGYVVWNGDNHDLLYDVEEIQFKDKTVNLEQDQSSIKPDGINFIKDKAKETQYVSGTEGQDAFVIDGDSKDYHWGKTQDNGYVVWNDEKHDLLYDVEELHFHDQHITLDDQAV